jgi:hypothetical protein
MGILNCACLCNNDIDMILLKYRMTVDNVEAICVIIQKHYRGYIFRRNIKYENAMNNKDIIKDAKFDEQWDLIYSNQTIEFSMKNLSRIKEKILRFYKDFFTHSHNGDIFYIKESLYQVSKKEDFLLNFKVAILAYIYDNFDLGSQSKMIEGISVECEKELDENLFLSEKLLDRMEISSNNSASFIKKFTFSSKNSEIKKGGSVFTAIESPMIKDNKKIIFSKNKEYGSEGNKNAFELKKLNISNQKMLINNPTLNKSKNEDSQGAFKITINTANKTTNGNYSTIEKSVDMNSSYQRVNSILKNKLPSRTRSIKLDKNLEKTPEFSRKQTRDQMNRSIKSNGSFFIGPDGNHSSQHHLSFPSLFGMNNRTTLENLIDEFNKTMKECKLVKMLEKSKGIYYEGTLNLKTKSKQGIGIQYMIDKEKGMRYKYLGYFKNDLFHGYGLLCKEDGYRYEGEFRYGVKCGIGFEFSEKSKYEGFFCNDKHHGYGETSFFHTGTNKIQASKSSSLHRGCYNQGFRENIGYLEYEDNSKYIGNFLFNKMNNIGAFFWPVGHSYYGTWKDEKMHGRGKYMWKNGDIYLGGYENDLRHGEGEYFFAERNSLLKGFWTNGKKNGRFKLYENGEFFSLTYRNDQQYFQN